MNDERSFDAFAARKTREAEAARINPLRTLIDRSAAFPLEAIGHDWSIRMYGGPFHIPPPPAADLPVVTLIFVQSAAGNTGAANPSDLGGGDTDKHLLYEGLSRVAVDAVLSGATTAAGPDVFFSVWHPELVALRLALGLPRHPAQVIVTGRGCIDVNRSLIFNVPDVPVFVIGSRVACAALDDGVRHRPWVRMVGLEPSGLRGALSTLRIDHGLRRISAIGGRTTATALVDEGLVQDLHLTTGATSAGEPHTPWYVGRKLPGLEVIGRKDGTAEDEGVLFEHLAVRTSV